MLVLMNLSLSVAMLTLILLIQVVHYPSFHFYDEIQFSKGMREHQRRISWLVIPLMLTEGLVALLMVLSDFSLTHSLSLLLVFIIWTITYTMQVPIHNKLSLGKTDEIIERLITGNIWRVVAWTLKTIIAAMLMVELIPFGE